MIITPAIVHGTINAPPSKSWGVRAVVAAMLAGGSLSQDFGDSDDVQAALRAAREWTHANASVRTGRAASDRGGGETTLNVGESALTARIMACVAALSNLTTVIAGEKTLLTRPMDGLVNALRQLGARVEPALAGSSGKLDTSIDNPAETLPLKITGTMHGGTVVVDGSEGSQTVTGLLMTLPLAAQNSVLRVTNPTSIPYIYMTLDLLAEFGIEVVHSWENDVWEFRIAGYQDYKAPPELNIEGDWSGVSCLLVAGAIAGEITVRGLSTTSPQADKAILDALRAAGAEVMVADEPAAGGGRNERSEYISPAVRGGGRLSVSLNARRGRLASLLDITIRGGRPLKAFEFDATHCPDLFPALVALAAACHGESVLTGALRLRGKESSRGEVLRDEYARLGIKITLDGDVMRVRGGAAGGGSVSGCLPVLGKITAECDGVLTVSSHGDHRIAMSLAVTALSADQPVVLLGTDAVAKSYPDFWSDLERLKQ